MKAMLTISSILFVTVPFVSAFIQESALRDLQTVGKSSSKRSFLDDFGDLTRFILGRSLE